jgi:tetratricopeptide (TPR) repeat protein
VLAAARAGQSLLFAGRYPLGHRLLERVERRSIPLVLDDPAVGTAVHRSRAVSALARGDQVAGLRHWPEAVRCALLAGDLRGACQARGNLANRYKELGGYAQAEKLLRDVIGAAERLGLVTVHALALHNLGYVLLALGRPADARPLEEEAARSFATQGDARLEAATRGYLAAVLLALGDPDAALDEATRGLDVGRGTPAVEAQLHAALARVELARQDIASALAHTDASMAFLATLVHLDEGDLGVLLARALALRAADRVGEAAQVAAHAIASLTATASRIEDPAWREAFLTAVPDHRELFALAAGLAAPLRMPP